ncbi:MAG: helix-turn-helix transcriptional regulator, partial [Gammaproteobacteria bacterium]
MDPELVDRIYESSFVPELWPGVLHEVGRIAEAGVSLFITNPEVTSWTASKIAHEGTAKFVKGGWFWRGQVSARYFAARHAGFLTDLDLFTRDELDQEPIYRDMWSQYGVGWAVATVIPIPTGENASFVLMRRTERGPAERPVVQKLDELRPHLARSALMSARLQLERARAASETLAALGLPALVLNEQGKVLAANPLIEAMTDYVQWRAQDRVSLKDRAADNLLRDAIAAIDVAGGSSVRSFPVRDADTQAMMVAHVVPIRLSARDIFVRCAAVLVLTPVTLPQAPPVELVQSLFDLTPAEARVARGLASGKTVNDIATDGGTSTNTIRTQVRGVLEKTGCNRQADIVALLTAISSTRLTASL